MMPIPIAAACVMPRQTNCDDAVRRRALERLYERWSVVDNLIQSLEDYQREGGGQLAECISINAGRKSSSDCAR
jgi:hypothetical protein